MKKLLSVLLAAIMSVSVMAVAAVPAFAVPSPTGSTAAPKGPITEVNGSVNDKDITFTPDANDSNTIIFDYTGEGTLIGWEENLNDLGLVEGTDYTKSENPDGTLTITFITDKAQQAYNNGSVVVNALVKFASTTTSAKKDDSSKSPSTGFTTSVVAGSIAVAGAGVAVLSAIKKRDAE